MSMPPVGIADLQHYAPAGVMTAAEIAERSGIPEDILHTRFGLQSKHIAAADEHVGDMCISAARPLLERTDPADVDAVVYFGSHWKERAVWQAAPKIQHALGIEGFSLETINVSAGAPFALKVCRDMLRSDEDLRSILLVGACKESQLLDYANERSRFMFNFGDGAVALLLQRGLARNEVLGSAMLTDGSFSDHVLVPAGGSAEPAGHQTVDARRHFLDVTDPQDMKSRLDPITMKHFLSVADTALERSGYERDDVALFLPIHMKRSIHDMLLVELGIREEQAVYLDTYGHMSAIDPLLGLSLARDEGRVNDGDVCLILAAGTGYSWAASVVRWGEAT